MSGFFSDIPPARDWFYGVRTFAASMLALYIALIMQMPRPYWAMATVYIVSSPFVAPTSSKALYRVLGTLLGASAAVFFVPLLVQTPVLLIIAVAMWSGTLLYLSLHVRTSNSYIFMLAGYTMPMIALPVVDNPQAVFDIAVSRSEEILLGIACAAVVGSVFWPRRLAPVLLDAQANWFGAAREYCGQFLRRELDLQQIGQLRARMVESFNSLEPMIGQLPHEGESRERVRRSRELRGRMIHLLPLTDALNDALLALEKRAPELFQPLQPLLSQVNQWLDESADRAPQAHWSQLRAQLEQLQPPPAALEDRHQLLLSNALYRLAELLDLWQDCRSLQHAIRSEDPAPWRAVYRHWRLGRLTPFLDRGMMLYSVCSTVLAVIVACSLWILLGWQDGASAVILAAVACSFFASMDDPAPQIYRFFFWCTLSVVFASLYLFLVLPNLHDFPMLVLAFAVPFICVGTLTVQPKFYLGTLLTIVNTSSFVSIQAAYDANFLNFINANLAGPAGLLFALIWTLLARPFGTELAARRLTRFSWRDIISISKPASLAQHRRLGVRMLDRLMQQLPRLALLGVDTGGALRDLRVALNLLDLAAYQGRTSETQQAALARVVDDIGEYFQHCLKARERLPAPEELLHNMELARQALSLPGRGSSDADRVQLLHSLSGLRLALLPGTLVVVEPRQAREALPQGIDGAPL